ncbi:MAG: tetratricopeptide repeat protein [Acidobacteriota bacterium]|nr:tetratricopeptide repeat protein [Acidobacteriota bacterium]
MIALVLPVSAQDEHISQQIAAIPRTSSDEVMQRPVKLMDGAGKMHQKVTTNSAIAQAYYDQGVAYLHSYVWVEAARSFHEALRHDPRLAMAHLGLAKAYTGATAYKDALTHLQKATEIVNQGNVTEKETRWIALGQQQLDGILSVSGDHNDRLQAYRQAIEELIALDPDDSHAWVLRGNAEERRISGRGQGGRVGSVAYYDAALKRDPSNFGAHHYLVHSYEGLGHYEKAAKHGKIYADAVLGVPHAQHMYAHVLPRLGKWEEALEQLKKADDLQREYFQSGVAPIEEWHHGHNIHVMGAVQMRMGNYEEAEKLFEEAFHLKVRSLRDGRFADPWLGYLLMRGRFEEALNAALEAEKRPLAIARFIGASRAAEALIALGRVDEAEQAQERMKGYFEQFRLDTNNPIYRNLQARYRERNVEVLEAQFALLGDNPEAGEAILIELADRFVDSKTLDGWVSGLFRIQELAVAAVNAGRQELTETLIERMYRIDPEYTPDIGGVLKK